MTAKGTVPKMQPTAFDEASRQTYGRLYWTITVVIVLATVAAWIWGEHWMQVTVGVIGLCFIVVVGVVNHLRMNRIVRERRADPDRDGG